MLLRLSAYLSATPDAAVRRFWRVAGYVVLGLGVLLRVVIWGQQRSINLDESSLLRNFAERDYGQLFDNLDYRQYAPPLFSVLVKACLQLFGDQELSARLVPLLSSVATLALLRRLAGRWLPPAYAWLALAFVAFGYIFLDYATECKQYATDGLVVLALLEVAHWLGQRPLTPGRALGLAALGAGAVWLSMPAIFGLAAMGLWLLTRAVAARDYRTGVTLVGVGASWALSFGVYFLRLLKANAESAYLRNFHRDYFLAFPPRSLAALHLLGEQLQTLGDRAIGKTVLALALAAIGFGIGAWQLWRRGSGEAAWLLLGPIGLCLLTSALGYYSLIPRLTLFFLPLVVLVVLLGLARLSAPPRPPLVGLVLFGLLLLTLGEQQRLANLGRPFYSDFGEVRSGLEYLAGEQQPGELAFMNADVAPIVRYYQQQHAPALRLGPVLLQDEAHYPGLPLPEVVRQLRQAGTRRLWLLYDRDDETVSAFAATQGRVLKRHNFQRGYVLLVEFQPLAAAAGQ